VQSSNEEIYHEDKIFENISYEEMHITGRNFDNCRFYKSSLKGCVLQQCTFDKCTFEECDLSLMKFLSTSFSDVKIINCKAIGIIWADTISALSVNFDHSRISFSSFYGKQLKKSRFINCAANDVDFTGCNLSQASFTGSDLQNAKFENTDLTRADFVGAKNYRIQPGMNKIKNAKFSLPEALSFLDSLDIQIVD